MHKPSEALLQFLWQHKLFKLHDLKTVAGHGISILKQGELNRDAGPDFSNAQIKLNDLVLVGNIELHVNTSDWLKHGHQKDNSYNTLILHVVFEHDLELKQNASNNVEVLELKNLVSRETLNHYEKLCDSKTKIACQGQLSHVNDLKFLSWMDRMTVERLEYKTERIESYFKAFNGDYTQSFYTLLLRSFGFGVNALPFELLAKHLPFTVLFKHADNLIQIEALLLGMAGLLDNTFDSKYMQVIQNEFDFLKNKYHLVPLQKELFKYSKMRPANFPSIRLAQLASLVHHKTPLFTQHHSYIRANELKKDLSVQLSDYWQHHFTPNGERSIKELTLGENAIESLIINCFVPFYFFYSKKTNQPSFQDTAFQLLESTDFETNTKTKLFSSKQHLFKSGANSQALLNLFDNYCSKKRCLKCGVAYELLNRL